MKSIKIKQHLLFYIVCICLSALLFTGCKKLFGLKLQENEEHITSTLDPHINKSAWQFLKDRALGSVPADTIFKRMYEAVVYSQIDTTEYTKSGRTFIFLHNDAVLRKSGSTTTTDCYFGKYKVNNVAATSWTQYPREQVKNYLLYLIAVGEHSFENVTPDPKYEKTLMPPGADTLNPESIIVFRVVNDRDSRFRINDFPGSAVPSAGANPLGIQARTAGILSTNGPIHVIDRVLFYRKV